MGELKRDLLDQGMELRETHISQVFLSAERVYKIKKPVQLGFLDFSTLALRKRYCEAELALNRRLAPDVYLRVLPIARDADGVHRLGGAGEVQEWAVEMRRLPDADSAEQRLANQQLMAADVERIAAHLARFHAAARCDAETAHYGSLEVITANVRENFEQTRSSAPRYLAARELQAIERWQLGFLADHAARFEARKARGRVRDGHGDLRLEHCYLTPERVEIIDCIEFNERFRYGDVCADVAFLAMDLAWHGREDLSEWLLATYAREADDYDLYGVVDFYESYRAFVRGKVSALLQDDAGVDAAARERAGKQARKYFLLAEACAREPLQQPTLYAVGGMIASGKSTLAEQLAARVIAPAIASDRTRKRLAGVDPLTPLTSAAFGGEYSAGASRNVYGELLRRAAVVLGSGRSVILDASFRSRNERQAARALAERMRVPFLMIECVVPPEVCKARLAERAKGPSISDGRLDIFDAFAQQFEPIDELPSEQHVRVDTSAKPEHALRALEPRLR